MICALIVIGLLSLGAVSATDISANDSPQSIYVEDVNHFVEVSNSEIISDNLNLLEANNLIAGNLSQNLSDNFTGNITLNSTDLEQNVINNEDSKLTLNKITYQKLSDVNVVALGSQDVDAKGVNLNSAYEDDLNDAILVIPENYTDEYGSKIQVKVILRNVSNSTFNLHGNDSLKFFTYNGVRPYTKLGEQNLSDGEYNATLDGYVYFFEVDSASYFNYDLLYTSIVAAVYPEGSEDTYSLLSNLDRGITFTKKCPQIAEHEVIVGNYSDVIDIEFIVTAGNVNDTVILHLINGSNVTTKVINQSGVLKAVFEDITLTAAGVYNTSLIFNGTGNYRNAIFDVLWNISKLNTTISFNPETPSGRTTEIIEINVTVKDQKGNLVKQGIAIVDDTNITLVNADGSTRANNTYEFINGVFTFYILENVNGTYNIPVNFTGGISTNNTDNYNPSNAIVSVNVAQTSTNITVENVSSKVDESKTITAHIFSDKGDINEGNATLTITISEGTTITQTVNVTNGIATFTNVSIPLADNYTTVVHYNGVSGKYQPASGYGSFNVTKNDTSVTVTNISTSIVGEQLTITVDVDGVNKNGSQINITIKDNTGSVVKSEIVNVTADGQASISFVPTKEGNYTVTADYLGLDKVYNPSNGTGYVNVTRSPTEITVENITTQVDEISSFNVTIKDAFNNPVTDGKVNVTINDKFIGTFDVTNGIATINNASYNKSGNWTVNVKYFDSEGKYLDNETTGWFNVLKNDTTVVVTNVTSQVGEEFTFNITVEGVHKEGSYVNVTIRNSTGDIVDTFTLEVRADGTANFTAAPDKAGIYNVTVDYLGLDGVYNPSTGNGTVTVYSNATVITVENVTTHVDETKSFNITIKDINGNIVTDGKVNVTIGDKFIGTFDVTNGIVTVNGTFNESGNYTVSVNYYGSEGKFLDNSTDNGKFEVLINETSISVEPVSGKVGENVTLNILVNGVHKAGTNLINVTFTDSTGSVVESRLIDIKADGTASITTSFNKSGIYNVTVKYAGVDKVYAPSNGTTNCTIGLIETSVNVTDIDSHVGVNNTINITVNGINQTGKVNVTITDIDGNVIDSQIINVSADGNASIDQIFDKYGTYIINAKYLGIDGVYLSSEGRGIAIIRKNDTVITVENITTNVSDSASFNVSVKDINGNNVTEGVVYVTIGNYTSGPLTVNNGIATVTGVSKDLADNYTVSVKYYGVDKFANSNGTGWFNVVMNNTSVVVYNVTSSQVGDEVTVNVTVDGVHKEGSKVLINITGPNGSVLESVNVTVGADGKASYTFDIFNVNGTYNVSVYYEGIEDVYNPSNATGFINVYKNATVITVENITTNVGDSESFNITVKDIYGNLVTEGKVLVKLEGNEFTLNVTNGIVTINNISYSTAGNRSINVSYFGSEGKYLNSTGAGYFNVLINQTSIIVDSATAKVGENVTANITVNGIQEAGKVNVTITGNGVNITKEIDVSADGKASISHIFDKNGTYNITVNYPGVPGVYNASTGQGNFFIGINETSVTVTDILDSYVGLNNTINITVNGIHQAGKVNVTITDKDGNVIATFNNVDVDAEGKSSINYIFDKHGIYNVTAKYLGIDGVYTPSEGTGFIHVDRVNTTVIVENITTNVDVPSSIKIYVKDINGNNVTEGTIFVNIGNKTVGPLTVVNGVAIAENISFSEAGNRTVVAHYYGTEDKYMESNGTAWFNVKMNDTTVVVTNITDVSVGTNVTVNVTVDGVHKAGSKVNITITDDTGSVVSQLVDVGADGHASISFIPELAGTYNVTAKYQGLEGVYNPSEGNGTVTVKTNATSVVVTNITDVSVGTNVTVNVTVDGVHKAGSKVNITITDDTGSVVSQLVDVGADGKASISFVPELAGTYNVTADYLGLEGVYEPSTGNGTVIVNTNATSVTVTNVTGQVGTNVTVNVTVDGVHKAGSKVNITITDDTGSVVSQLVDVGADGKASISFVPELAGTYNVTADYLGLEGVYEPSTGNGTVNVLINQTSVHVDNKSSHVGEEVTINITVDGVHKQGSKLVNVTIKDSTGKVIDTALVDIDAEGKASYSLALNKSGIYDVTAKYLGVDGVYTESTGYGFINVSMNATVVSVENVTTRINESANITISVKDVYGNNVTGGTVTITVNGTEFGPFNVTDGKAVIEDVKVGFSGNFTVTAEYSGYDGVYEAQTSEGWIDVLKYEPDITTTPTILDDVIPGSEQNITINITTPIGDVTVDKVNVTLPNGTTLVDVPVVDGQITITLPADIQEGQNITISVPETETSYSSDVDVPIGTVALVPTYIVSEYPVGQDYFDGIYAQTTNLTFRVYDCYGNPVKSGTKVIVDVDGIEYYCTVFNDGEVVVPVVVNTTGLNVFTVKYIGDDYYDNCSNTTNVFINNLTTVMEITGMVDDVYPNPDNTNVTIVVKTTDGDVVTKGQLTYTLPDGSVHVVDITGESTVLHIDVNRTGDYTIDVKYVDTPEDTHFAACNGTFDWHVVPGQTNTTLDVVVIDGVAYVEATVIDGKGNLVNEGNVTITINGKEFTVNVTDGKAIVSDSVEHGIYTLNVSATYNANENYNESSANTTYIIKQNLIITVDDISGKPGQNVLVPVHVVTEDGVPVSNITVKVTLPNGKVIEVAIVDGVGYFKMTLPKVPGKYSLLVSFDGDDYYYPANATVKVTVKSICHGHGIPMQHTANPILALLLVLLSLPLVRFRKN